MRGLVMLALMAALAVEAAAMLPPRSAVLDEGARALAHFQSTTEFAHETCDWLYSTFTLGVTEFAAATDDAALRSWLRSFGDRFKWQMCPLGGLGRNPDNQIVAATYAALFQVSPPAERNTSWLAAARAEYDEQIAAKQLRYYAWVDTLFMSMNTLARLGEITGDDAYLNFMHANFLEAVATEPEGFGFWSPADALFYRDPPSNPRSRRGVFWARGNGWAVGALAAAIEHSKPDDARRGVYASYLRAMAQRLRALQGADGCWRASLTNAAFNPTPETTGTALFTYALARGIALGILGAADYAPTVEAGWRCLTAVSLQPSGQVGFCQPVGAGPGRNFDASSTNSFCVGQFLLAVTAVAQLSGAAAA